MSKIVAVSDMHGQLPDIPECDILVLGGDNAPDFMEERPGSRAVIDKGAERQREWYESVFADWLCQVPAKHAVGIGGNHDFGLDGHAPFAYGLPWTYLLDEEATIEGLRVYGTPWVPNLQFWAFYGSDAALQARAEAIPEGLDILISHGPPLGQGDRVKGWQQTCLGDVHLAKAIVRKKPRVTVCGHIHEGFGKYESLGVPVYNASILDEMYDHVNPNTEIEIWPKET